MHKFLPFPIYIASLVVLLFGFVFPVHAQDLPSCDDSQVFDVAVAAVTEAHKNSNFGGLGAENKVILVLKDLRPPGTTDEREAMENGAAFLAELAGYEAENNIRGCYTSEWGFQLRAAVFIMRSPDDPSEWGLFMNNVALDLPVATGWLMEPPPGEPAANP